MKNPVYKIREAIQYKGGEIMYKGAVLYKAWLVVDLHLFFRWGEYQIKKVFSNADHDTISIVCADFGITPDRLRKVMNLSGRKKINWSCI